MDPEELYRLLEKQQEQVYHTKTSGYEDDEQDPSDPNDIYQYLNSYQPIQTTIEVTCGPDEAPDTLTLPTLGNTFLMFILPLFIPLLILIFLHLTRKRIKNNERIKNQRQTIESLLKEINEKNYKILIWTHPNLLLSLFTLLIELIESSTQRLFKCDNELETVSLDSLQKQIEQTKIIFKHLLDEEDSYAHQIPLDSDEKLLMLTNAGSLRILRERLLDHKRTIDYFIETRNSIIYELNNARSEENVSVRSHLASLLYAHPSFLLVPHLTSSSVKSCKSVSPFVKD